MQLSNGTLISTFLCFMLIPRWCVDCIHSCEVVFVGERTKRSVDIDKKSHTWIKMCYVWGVSSSDFQKVISWIYNVIKNVIIGDFASNHQIVLDSISSYYYFFFSSYILRLTLWHPFHYPHFVVFRAHFDPIQTQLDWDSGRILI